MNKKVLMVYPKIPTTYWSFKYALKFIGKKTSIPPLGLLTVAAMLPDSYEVNLIDMNTTKLTPNEIREADLVFISAMIVQKRSFTEVVKMCNECGKPVVAGGPYPISFWKKIKGVDYFVLDEAESTLPEFLKDLEAGCPQPVYRAVKKPDLTGTPVPRFDLIDPDIYSSMPLQFSRGCPYNCEFCDITEMFGRTPRTKLPEQFIMEMEEIYKTGFRYSIFIVDDNFVGNKRKVKALLRGIIAWQKDHGYPFSFFTEASIDLAEDDELLGLMKEAGFNMVFIGIETPDEETLSLIQKKQNIRIDVLSGIKKIQRLGMEVSGGFIIGFDNDRIDIFDRQVDFIQEAGIPMAMIGLLTAIPNTQLFRRLEKEGRIVGEATGNNTHDLKMNFIPRLPEKILIEGYKRILAKLYSPATYFERCRTLLNRNPAGSMPSRPISKTEIRAFLLSLIKQTFSSYGIQYLGFLIGVLRENARLLPEAVTLAVRGHHFFTITEEILKAHEFSTLLNKSRRFFQIRIARLAGPVGKQKQQLTAEVEAQVIKLRNNLQRKYRKLSRGVQHCLQDTFPEFEAHCEILLAHLRLSYCG